MILHLCPLHGPQRCCESLSSKQGVCVSSKCSILANRFQLYNAHRVKNDPKLNASDRYILNHLWNNSMKAQWIRLRLPSCCPGFVPQAHHLRFFQFIKKFKLNICHLNYNVKRRKINEKVAGIGPFLEQLNESKKRNI